MCYSYARLSRNDFGFFRFPISGVGLGNLLFPWARFIVNTRKYNLKPIYPTWPQIRIGPIIRRESDKRFYHNLFQRPKDQIGGLRKLYFLSTLDKISELDYEQKQRQGHLINEDVVVIFEGVEGYFSKILKDHELVFNELLHMVRAHHKQHKYFNYFLNNKTICVHVRLGDFSKPANNDILLKGAVNYRIPLSWYKYQIEKIREVVSAKLPVCVFSDGRDSELAELLTMDNVKRIHLNSSIAELLALSQSSALIASGSTFGMWASYLGRMPVIWYRGQLRQRLYYENEAAEVECGEGETLPDAFTNILACNLKN